jgi:apolipoprotein N-acyltransferase
MIHLKSLINLPFFLAGLSGVILLFSFNHSRLWFLALIALIPLIHLIYLPTTSSQAKFFYGCVAGTAYALGFLVWHWSVLPLDWVGINNFFVGVGVVFYVWFLQALLIGVVIGLWVGWASFLKQDNWTDLLLFSLSWPVFEFIRAFALSLLWYGNGSVLGFSWTVGFLGYVLAPGPFISFASWGGVYLVGAAGIAINFLIYKIIKNYKDRSVWLAAVVFLVIWAGSVINVYFLKQDSGQEAKMAVINTYEQSFSRMNEEEIKVFVKNKKDLLTSVAKSGNQPDIVIFPEDARTLLSYAITNDQLAIKNMFAQHETLIIDSARLTDKTGFPKLTFQYLNTRTGELKAEGKNFLVPHGEYMPFLTDFLGGVIGQSEWVTSFRHSRETSRPTEPQNGFVFGGMRFQATACSEIILPTVHDEIANRGVPILINSTSHSLFRGSPVLYRQTISMAKMRAVENNRYFVAANNFIPSFIIDNHGNLVEESAWDQQSVLYATVPLLEQGTIYNKIYWFFPWFLVILTLILSFISYRSRAKMGS